METSNSKLICFDWTLEQTILWFNDQNSLCRSNFDQVKRWSNELILTNHPIALFCIKIHIIKHFTSLTTVNMSLTII